MNTVPTRTTIHTANTARRWFTHQRATRRISVLLTRSPRVGEFGHEATERRSACRRPSGRTFTTPPGADMTLAAAGSRPSGRWTATATGVRGARPRVVVYRWRPITRPAARPT